MQVVSFEHLATPSTHTCERRKCHLNYGTLASLPSILYKLLKKKNIVANWFFCWDFGHKPLSLCWILTQIPNYFLFGFPWHRRKGFFLGVEEIIYLVWKTLSLLNIKGKRFSCWRRNWVFLIHQGIGLEPYKQALLQKAWWLLPKFPPTWERRRLLEEHEWAS